MNANLRSKRAWYLGVFCSLLLLYASMVPTRLSGMNYSGDSGDFLSALLTGGIPHPTGYPAYLLLATPAARIPLGTPYQRVGLISAICMAATAAIFQKWLAERVLPGSNHWKNRIAALTAIIWGTLPLVWSQAVIVEVYALNSLFVILWLWWADLLTDQNGASPFPRKLYAFASIAGISIGNHLTILFWFPVIVMAFILARRNGCPLRNLLLQAIITLGSGIAIYLLLPLRAYTTPPINWGNPIDLAGLFWLVRGTPYQAAALQVPPMGLLQSFANVTRAFLDQFMLPAFILGAFGLARGALNKRIDHFACIWGAAVSIAFVMTYRTADATIYLIPAMLAFSVWIASALNELVVKSWKKIPAGKILVFTIAILTIFRVGNEFQKIDPRQNELPADFAENYLHSAPQNAILIAQRDEDIFPLWYYHFGLGWRPDVHVLALPLTQFVWYQQTFKTTYPELLVPLLGESPTAEWGRMIVGLNPTLPVCNSQPDASAPFKVSYSCQE